jgi:predicted nucleic acid-binding protein
VRLVVDTNIVFSAILNSSGNIGKILTHYARHFELYSCQFLKEEISAHLIKLKRLTKISDAELAELIQLTTSNIHFINEKILPEKDWHFAFDLLKNLDPKDIAFVALNHHLKAHLWTGDKRLIKGLLNQGYNKVLTTQALIETLEK